MSNFNQEKGKMEDNWDVYSDNEEYYDNSLRNSTSQWSKGDSNYSNKQKNNRNNNKKKNK